MSSRKVGLSLSSSLSPPISLSPPLFLLPLIPTQSTLQSFGQLRAKEGLEKKGVEERDQECR